MTPPRWRRPSEVTTKRLLGALAWLARRRGEHRPEVLEALLGDLERTAPDRVLVTGDVTNQGLPGELDAGRGWLERLGGPERVFLVPGNHDVYAGDSRRAMGSAFGPFLAGDPASTPPVRVQDGVALVGVHSARPTAPGLATGRVGPVGRLQLERCLRGLERAGLRRIVLIHHPPWTAGIRRRRGLDDAAELVALLSRAGAELVVHGHVHRFVTTQLPGPSGPIPVVGVPSASALGHKGSDRRARYHLLEPRPEGGWACRARVLDPSRTRFEEGEPFGLP